MLQKIKKVDKKTYDLAMKDDKVCHLEAKVRLYNQKRKYRHRKKCAYCVCFLGTLGAFFAGLYLPPAIYFGWRKSTYGRESLDFHLLELFGDRSITQALREVTVIAYDMYSDQPRIYSQWSAQ